MKKFIAALSILFTITSIAAPVEKVVVFGDSLSDNGNLFEYMKHQLPLSPPYFDGRFSNGPVWVERFVMEKFHEKSKEHLFDYAVGGAGVSDDSSALFSLHNQVDSYFMANGDKADANTIYIVWIGANNYLALPDDEDKAVADVNDGIEQELELLASRGAKYIAVANLPDLGRIPAANDFESKEKFSIISHKHNQELERRIANLKAKYPHVTWPILDAYSEMTKMLDNPANYGLTNVTDTCYEAAYEEDQKPSVRAIIAASASPKPELVRGACDGYLFFDPVHPAAQAHKIMANYVKQTLAESSIELG